MIIGSILYKSPFSPIVAYAALKELNSILQEVFEFFINFKNKANDKLEEEKDSVLPKNVSKGYEQARILQSLGELHPYFYEKIKKQYHDGLNYNIEDSVKVKGKKKMVKIFFKDIY